MAKRESKINIFNYKKYPPQVKKIKEKKLVHFYNSNFPLSSWSNEYFNSFLNDENKRKMECFILKRNKKIIGFILGRKVGNIRFRYNLTTLLVDKRFRGKGYSKLLLNEFLKNVKKNKSVQKVYLHFRDSNNFKEFYKHCGFRGHRIAGTYSNGEKKHFMEIKL